MESSSFILLPSLSQLLSDTVFSTSTLNLQAPSPQPKPSSTSSIPKPLRALLEATQAPSAVAARQAAAASARQLATRAGAAAGAAASRGARSVAANVVPAPARLARALQERRRRAAGGEKEEKEGEEGDSSRGGGATTTSSTVAESESSSPPSPLPRLTRLRRPGSPLPSSPSSPSPPGSPPRSAAPPLPTRRRRVVSLGRERAKAPPPPPRVDHGHPVLELVRLRQASGSKPGKRAPGDTATLALVVEGGGMRGAVSGGGLQALHDLGLRDAFDVVYGSSAGAINATYFLSGQRDGVDIYPVRLLWFGERARGGRKTKKKREK